MVPNVHARKLPARKSRDVARDGMRVLVVNKHGRFGQLKKCRVPLLFSMKVLFIEEEKIYISETVRKELECHKAGRKGAKKDISRAKEGR